MISGVRDENIPLDPTLPKNRKTVQYLSVAQLLAAPSGGNRQKSQAIDTLWDCYKIIIGTSSGGGVMNKLLLSVIGLGALAVSAPAFAAPLPPPIEMWNGWYVGGNVGASFGTAKDSSTIGSGVPFSSTSANLNGVIGGAQFGYNYHATPSWLLGFESDFQGSGEQASATTTMTTAFTPAFLARQFPPPNTLVDVEKLQWFGTVRGRIGWTPNQGALLYLTGGLAYGGVTSNPTFNAFSANFSTTRVGWVVGTGVEVFIVKNWTAKAEYLYMDLGSVTNTFNVGLAPPVPFVVNSHITDQIVRVGFNYHFN